jgi:hypothetical protein
MTDQQTSQPGDRDEQDPYPADLQFGAAAAEDQRLVDAGDDQGDRDAPRAANKAEPAEGDKLPAEAGADVASGEAPTG